MFNYYNKQGPLFVIVPNPPEHTGERYQFHFESKQFMNEKDHGIGLEGIKKLVERCPELTVALGPWGEKFAIGPLIGPEYRKIVADFTPQAIEKTNALVTQYKDRIAAFGIKSLAEYGVHSSPEAQAELMPLVTAFIDQAMPMLSSKRGFWSKLIENTGTERNEDKIEALLSADPMLTSLAENSDFSQKATALLMKIIPRQNKAQTTHLLDLILKDPLIRFLMKQIPKMYIAELQERGHAVP